MTAEYTYRRKLRATEVMPALAAGFGVGVAVFYLARLFLQRTPLVPRSPGSPGLGRVRPPRAAEAPRAR